MKSLSWPTDPTKNRATLGGEIDRFVRRGAEGHVRCVLTRPDPSKPWVPFFCRIDFAVKGSLSFPPPPDFGANGRVRVVAETLDGTKMRTQLLAAVEGGDFVCGGISFPYPTLQTHWSADWFGGLEEPSYANSWPGIFARVRSLNDAYSPAERLPTRGDQFYASFDDLLREVSGFNPYHGWQDARRNQCNIFLWDQRARIVSVRHLKGEVAVELDGPDLSHLRLRGVIRSANSETKVNASAERTVRTSVAGDPLKVELCLVNEDLETFDEYARDQQMELLIRAWGHREDRSKHPGDISEVSDVEVKGRVSDEPRTQAGATPATTEAPTAERGSREGPLNKPVGQLPTDFSASVAFVIIPGLKGCDPRVAYNALRLLHAANARLLAANEPGSVISRNALEGLILVAPDDYGAVLHEHVQNLFHEAHSLSLPLRAGVTHGRVRTMEDFDDTKTIISRVVNKAARLAFVKKVDEANPGNDGCLIDREYADTIFNGAHLPKGHWLSPGLRDPLVRQVRGKRSERFACIQAPSVEFPSDPTEPFVHPSLEEKIPTEARLNASFALAYDLSKFSEGDPHQLRTRFARVVDVVRTTAGGTPGGKFLFSPGGDGGILVLSGVDAAEAYRLAERLMGELDLEAMVMAPGAETACRIGLHYGPVLLYKDSDGVLRPTGDTLFAADQLTADKEAREAGSVVFSGAFWEPAAGGNERLFDSQFRWLTSLDTPGRSPLQRFVRRKPNSLSEPSDPR